MTCTANFQYLIYQSKSSVTLEDENVNKEAIENEAHLAAEEGDFKTKDADAKTNDK